MTWRFDRSEVQGILHDLLLHRRGGKRDPQVLLGPSGEPLGALSMREAGYLGDSLDLLEAAGLVNQSFHLHEYGIEDNLLRLKTLDDWADLIAESWGNRPERFSFRSSGSTGQPVVTVHVLSRLWEEAGYLAARIGDRRRIWALVPSHHIYGFLFTALLPKVMAIPNLRGQGFGARALRESLLPGDLLVNSPSGWRYLHESWPAQAAALPPGLAGTSSGAPCPPERIQALLKMGIERIWEIYGSSETAGIGLRSDPSESYELMPFWRRAPGQPGYLQPLNLKNSHECAEAVPSKAWEEPDHLEWLDQRRFRPLGRRDGLVQVAGYNVSPSYVASVLAKHPGVAAVEVRRMAPHEGEHLKAFCVPDPTRPMQALDRELIHALRHWAEEQLSPPERPAAYRFGDQLPRTEQGKPADWELA